MYNHHYYHEHLEETKLASTRVLSERWPRSKIGSLCEWHQRSMSRRKEKRENISISRCFRICPLSPAASSFISLLSIAFLFFISFSHLFSPTLAEHNQHDNYIHYRYEQYLPSINRPPIPTTASSSSLFQQQHNTHHYQNKVAQLQSSSAISSPPVLVTTSRMSTSHGSTQLHTSQHNRNTFSISTVSPSTMLPHSESSASYHQMANYSGDIMIGAVFPIHDRDANYSCGQLQMESLQQMESLVYSLKRINDDPTVGKTWAQHYFRHKQSQA